MGKIEELIFRPKGRLKRGELKTPPSKGIRGPPPKIRRPKPLSGERDLRRGVRRPGRVRTHNHRQRISPPASREYEKGELISKEIPPFVLLWVTEMFILQVGSAAFSDEFIFGGPSSGDDGERNASVFHAVR